MIPWLMQLLCFKHARLAALSPSPSEGEIFIIFFVCELVMIFGTKMGDATVTGRSSSLEDLSCLLSSTNGDDHACCLLTHTNTPRKITLNQSNPNPQWRSTQKKSSPPKHGSIFIPRTTEISQKVQIIKQSFNLKIPIWKSKQNYEQ